MLAVEVWMFLFFCPQNKPQGELYVLTLTVPPSTSLTYFLVFCHLCFTVRKSSFMLWRSIFFCTPFVVGERVIFLAPLKKKKQATKQDNCTRLTKSSWEKTWKFVWKKQMFLGNVFKLFNLHLWSGNWLASKNSLLGIFLVKTYCWKMPVC